MFAFTRKTDYALVALACLAEEKGQGAFPRLSARQIAERHEVPLPLLMNVLKDLVGGGIVTSTRGSRGGYSLARVPGAITVTDVISATEGQVKVMSCCGPEEPEEACQECRIAVTCPITRSVRQLNERIHVFLTGVTIEDLMSQNPDDIGPIPLTGIKASPRPAAAKGER